ncbi:MAG: hypothetical protein ACYCO3_03050, partial [Mycobacteriales bacterium]
MTRRSPPDAGSATGVVSRPPSVDLVLLAVAIAAVSTSGPLIAAAAAPALAVAFWRNAFASAALLPLALLKMRTELARL